MARKPTRQFSRLSVERKTPESTKALLSKLTVDPHDPKAPAEARRVNISKDLFEGLSKETGQKLASIDGIYQLLPDIELAEQVLVGSILSPKDLSTADVGFAIREGEYHSEIAGPFLEVVKTHFKKEYRIDEKLDAMLTEILFTKGAYIQAVLPENNLDMIINAGSRHVSTEAFGHVIQRFEKGQPLGLLGSSITPGVGMEHYSDTQRYDERVRVNSGEGKSHVIPHLRVSDNFETLKVPNMRKRLRGKVISQTITAHNRKLQSVGLESQAKGLSPEEIDKLYHKDHPNTPTHTVVPQEYMSRPSVGHPLVMKLPVESVIPVFTPGQPEDHVGYFLLLDENSRPVVRDGSRDYYNEIRSTYQGTGNDNASDIVKLAREAFGGVTRNRDMDIEQINNAYSKILENDLLNRLRNGLYREEFSLGMTEAIQEIMLYRALKAQQTQLIYIPEELVVYMAYDYSQFGIGRSLVTRTEIIASMRSVLLFADTMSGVRNAIGRKRVSISPDADSLDPEKDISDIQNLILESSARGFPLASPDPGQTLDYLHRAGYDFQINIEGDNYPNTKVEFDDYTTNVQAGNPELEDRLRRMQISSYGLNPEQVDPTQSPDFATSVVNNNLMLARRVIRRQKQFCQWLTKFVRLYIRHSSILMESLTKTLEEHKTKLTPEQRKVFTQEGDGEELIDGFIDAIELSLPSPDTTKEDAQFVALEQHAQLLDRALESHITEDLFTPEMLAAEPDAVRNVIAVIRSYYMRVWMEKNNILPELTQLTEMEGPTRPGFNLLEIQDGLMGSVGKAIQKYLKSVDKRRKKWEEEKAKLEEAAGGGDDFSDTAGMDDDTPEEDVADDDVSFDEEGESEEGGELEEDETPEEESGDEESGEEESGDDTDDETKP
jgi:hypothetical protein